MKKQLISLITAIIMLVGTVPVFAEDAEILSAVSGVESHKYAEMNNLKHVNDEGLGSNSGYGWARYENVDFGNDGIEQFQVNVATQTGYGGNMIKFYVDSMGNEPFAELKVEATGGWTNHKAQMAEVKDGEIYGVHNVYVTIQTTATGNIKSFRAIPPVSDEMVIPSSVINAGIQKEFSILTALDIITYDKDAEFNADAEVTAYDFVKAALMLKGETSEELINSMLTLAGLKKDEIINGEKACLILMYLLNRHKTVPEGALNYEIARQLGIKCEAPYDVALTWKDAIRLLYTATDVAPAVLNSMIYDTEGAKGVYTAKTNNTLLIENRKIHKSKGIVTMDSISGLTKESDIAYNQILIGKYIFDIGECNVNGLLGYEVEYYYHSSDYEDTLLYIEKTKNNSVIELGAKEMNGYSQGNITYYEDTKEKSVKISDSASIIYNGIVVSKYDSNMFNFKTGSIELISNNRDYVVDVVKLWNTKDYRFSGYLNGMLYFKDINDAEISIPYEAAGTRLNLMNSSGKEIIPEKVADNSICTIAQVTSIGGSFTYYNIWASKRTAIGDVKNIDRTQAIVKIGDTEYPLSHQYIDENLQGLYIGAGVKAWFNKYGEVARVDNDAVSTEKLGYIVKSYVDPDSEIPFVRIFTEDGKMVDYKCYENIRINGDRKNYTDAYNILSTKTELCLFTANNIGLLREINFAVENSDTSEAAKKRGLYSYDEVDEQQYKAANSAFGEGLVILSSEFIQFKIPADPTKYDKYAVAGIDFIDAAGKEYTLMTYNRVQGRLDVAIGVQEVQVGGDEADENSDLKYINKVTEEWNDDTGVPDVTVEYYDGTTQELKTMKVAEGYQDTVLGLKTGDAVRFNKNSNGLMTGLVRVYTLTDNGDGTISVTLTGDNKHTGAAANSSDRSILYYGKITQKQSSIVEAEVTGCGATQKRKFTLASTAVYVYENEELSVGTVNDIITAGGGSYICAYTRYGGVKSIVVIK